MSAAQPEARPLLYYSMTLCCPFCPGKPFTCRVVAEVEPPPDTIFRLRCPQDGMPLAVRFSNFKPCDPFPPDTFAFHYPPKPEPPKPRWWQFWKR
jgi:hypothetical protein